jgi:hypothetical protein
MLTAGDGEFTAGGPDDLPLRAAMALTTDDIEGFCRFFERGPVAEIAAVWAPEPVVLQHPVLQRFHAAWQKMPGVAEGGIGYVRDFDVFAFSGAVGFMLSVDVERGGADFRYRVYGSRIAERTGHDLTGRRLSEPDIPPGEHLFSGALYRAVLRRRHPLFVCHREMEKPDAPVWLCFLVPLMDGADDVVRLLGAAVPKDHRESPFGPRSVYN